MNASTTSKAFFLFTVTFCLLLHGNAGPLSYVCSGSQNNSTNTNFNNNLDSVFHSLSIKAPLTGFAISAVGQNPDRVNALTLCRGDVSISGCKACIKTASIDIRQSCPGSNEAIVWFDNCLLRYSNVDFFTTIDNKNKFYLWNVRSVADPVGFGRQLSDLMNHLSHEASFVQPSMFATAEIKWGKLPRIYGLAQCSRDLSNSDCKECLDSVIADIPSCCGGKEGGRVLTGSCNIRYELYPFFSA